MKPSEAQGEVSLGQPPIHPSFREALGFWAKLGCINFGGPAGQIAIMHRELVERRRWIGEQRFLHALNFCMLLPGPEAQQLALYVGWLLHRTLGGIAAGALFVVPSVFVLAFLSWLYATHGTVPEVAASFGGLKAVVVAIVAASVIRIGRRALRSATLVAIAAGGFFAIRVLAVPFPFVVLGASAAGFAASFLGRGVLRSPPSPPLRDPPASPARTEESEAPGPEVVASSSPAPRPSHAARVLAAGLALWLIPVLLLAELARRSGNDTLLDEATFFTKAALVTFGGACAVLSYMATECVQVHGWLTAAEMMDGLGLAETTPGPLIMVTAFVGFLAGHRHPWPFDPVTGGLAGLLVATYFTFLPSFVFILLGAPHVERMRASPRLAAALAWVTAAVVGVILNLALVFGSHVLFPFPGGTPDPFPALLAVAAFVALTAFDVGAIPVVAGGALAGLVAHFALGA